MARHIAAIIVLVASATPAVGEDDTSPPIDFNRHVRPILSDRCFQCHGPDSAARKADLRLDSREGALAGGRSGRPALVPGDAEASHLLERISAADPLDRMPPPSIGKTLTVEEIEILRAWIAQGAAWQEHWSFIPPVAADPPAVADDAWPRNDVDRFILARLEREGLAPSPEADRTTLIRRLSLDLTGLPPTVAEVDAFLADDAPGAYERLVERLLASDRYGEHMARAWLDAARYGDTHGLHLDNNRSMWRWRDWVIGAFNDNMPFDRFTIEQLAGDLLPEPTLEQQIATGFNRNNVTTSEGGAIDAEYLVKYAVDRVETTSTVWMGLTAGCASCHDHKFDPLTQEEFYGLFAFFNNVAERAMDGNKHDPPPVVAAPTAEQQRTLDELARRTADLEARLDAPMPELDAAQADWEQHWRSSAAARWQVLEPTGLLSTGGAELTLLDDGSVLAGGPNPDTDVYEVTALTDATALRVLRLEALTHETLPETGPGRAENANLVLSEIEMEAVSLTDPGRVQPIRFVNARADHEQANGSYFVHSAIDGVTDDDGGWAVEGYNRREDRHAMFLADAPFGFPGGTELRIRLRHESKFARHAIGRFRLAVSADDALAEDLAPSRPGPWHVVGPFPAASGNVAHETAYGPERAPGAVDLAATYADGGLTWAPRPGFVDGALHTLEGQRCATYLHRVIEAPTARTVELALGSDDAIRLWVNGELVHDNNARRPLAADQDRVSVDLRPGPNRVLMKIVNEGGGYGFAFRIDRDAADSRFAELTELLASGAALDEEERTLVRRYFRRRHAPELGAIYEQLREIQVEAEAFRRTLPVTLVMAERDERRPAYVLRRGEYDQPLHEVSPGVPAVLPPLPEDDMADRLGLARWLVDPDHPLTARVTVNRVWQHHFGTGLVRTAEDFGSQGEWPSHPDLLDRLAVTFVENGWDLKALHRLIVTSATYRQTSAASPSLHARDPGNRLLARGPRFRMDAETIRDLALATSGLLVEQIGGPSVKPYQPPGLWKDVAYPDSDTQVFRRDDGEALYRRSLYTYWKRTSPPPSLAIFDAPSRETCTVRRPRTNTPLQALVLMNDTQFVEAARMLAQRTMLEAGPRPADRIEHAFRTVLSRRPDAGELEVLLECYERQLEAYRSDPEAAAALLAIGEADADPTLAAEELAAWTTVASVLLNLDETITMG
jgi:mono/diheme cytochrome c family protein